MPQNDSHRVETTSWLEVFTRYQDRIAAWTMLIARLDDEIAGAAPAARLALRDRRSALRAKRDATVLDLDERGEAYLRWLDAELASIERSAADSPAEFQARIAGWTIDLRRDWSEAHHALQGSTERYIRTLDAEIGRMQLESADGEQAESHRAEIAALHAHQQATWSQLKALYEAFRQRCESFDRSFLFVPGLAPNDRPVLT